MDDLQEDDLQEDPLRDDDGRNQEAMLGDEEPDHDHPDVQLDDGNLAAEANGGEGGNTPAASKGT